MSRFLRVTLAVNALFSATCGAVLIVGHVTLADTIGVPAPLLAAGGVALLAFAGAVAVVAARSWRLGARMVLAADVAWVVGAAVVLAGFRDLVTIRGAWMLAIVTLIVLDLAIAEGVGLRHRRA